MKTFLISLLLVLAVSLEAAVPSTSDFNANQFVQPAPNGKMVIKSGAQLTNTAFVGTLTLNGGPFTNGGGGGGGAGYAATAPLTLTGTNFGISSTAVPWTNSAGIVQLVTQTNNINLGTHGVDYPGQVQIQGKFDLTNTTFGAVHFRALGDQSQQLVEAYDFFLEPADADAASSTGPGVYSYAGHFRNLLYQSNSIGVVYLTGGNIGLLGEAGIGHQTPIKIGESAGLAGKAYGYGSLQIGTIGVGYSIDNGQTNTGVAGYAVTEGMTGTFVGVYGEVSTDTSFPPKYVSAAGLFDNRDTGLPVFIAKTNEVEVLKIDGQGRVHTPLITASRLVGTDSANNLTNYTLGAGLTQTGTTISATGGGGGTNATQLQGITISSSTPLNNQLLRYNSSTTNLEYSSIAELQPVMVVATANIASLSGTTTIDGTALSAGNRVLLTGQTTASQNGLWTVSAGAWTRPMTYSSGSSVSLSSFVLVALGTINSNSIWQITGLSTNVVVDTTSTTWKRLNLTPLTSQGDVLSHDGTLAIRVPIGAEGTMLRATSGNVAWSTDGSVLTALNASQLTVGTVPDARLNGANPIFASVTVTNATAGAITLSETNGIDQVRITAPDVILTNLNIILPDRPGSSGLGHYTMSSVTNQTMTISPVVDADISGTVGVAHGGIGTSLSSVAKGGLISGTGAGTFGITTVGTDGQMLIADAGSTAGIKWTNAPTGGGGGSTASTALVEEFFGGLLSTTVSTGPLGLFKTISGASANTTTANATTTNFGVVQLATGTTTTGYTEILNDGASVCFGTRGLTNTFKFRVQTLPDGAETYTARIGFGDSITAAAPTDGVLFRISTNDTHFVCVTRSNNVETLATNTTTVVANQWYVGKIVIADDGSTATFTIDGTDSVVMGGLPIGTSRLTGLQASILKEGGSVGTTSRTLHIDKWALDYYRGDSF